MKENAILKSIFQSDGALRDILSNIKLCVLDSAALYAEILGFQEVDLSQFKSMYVEIKFTKHHIFLLVQFF